MKFFSDFQNILLIVGITILISLAFHYWRDAYLYASVFAALACSFIYQLISYIDLGYLDPLFLVSLITGTFFALAVALIVGIPFVVYRKRRARQQPAT